MARPREFDEIEVLERALQTFWSKGYDGTSVEDLVQATGLGRASLYGAFGDKERLFARVLDHYVAKAEALDPEPSEDTPPEAALRAMATRWVNGTCPTEGPRGCFLSLSGTSGASADFVRETWQRSSAHRQRVLAKLIARGQESGAFRSKGDPKDLARFLIVLQQGLSTAARAGTSKRELSAAMKEAIDHVVG